MFKVISAIIAYLIVGIIFTAWINNHVFEECGEGMSGHNSFTATTLYPFVIVNAILFPTPDDDFDTCDVTE